MAQMTSTAAFGMKTAFIREECVLIPLCFLFRLSGRGWDEDIDALPSGSGGYDEKSSCNVVSYRVNRHVCTYALVHASFSSRHGIYAAVRCQVSSISCLMAAACAQPHQDNALQRRTPSAIPIVLVDCRLIAFDLTASSINMRRKSPSESTRGSSVPSGVKRQEPGSSRQRQCYRRYRSDIRQTCVLLIYLTSTCPYPNPLATNKCTFCHASVTSHSHPAQTSLACWQTSARTD